MLLPAYYSLLRPIGWVYCYTKSTVHFKTVGAANLVQSDCLWLPLHSNQPLAQPMIMEPWLCYAAGKDPKCATISYIGHDARTSWFTNLKSNLSPCLKQHVIQLHCTSHMWFSSSEVNNTSNWNVFVKLQPQSSPWFEWHDNINLFSKDNSTDITILLYYLFSR